MHAQVVWFKRDLRVTDHRPLFNAMQAGPVLPLYVDEPELWAQSDVSMRHRMFVGDALHELQQRLAELGLRLCIVRDDIERLLGACRDRFTAFTLWSHEETGNGWTYARDLRVGAWCREQGVAWHEIPQNGVVRALQRRRGWAQRWEERMHEAVTPRPQRIAEGLSMPGITPQMFCDARDPLQQRGLRTEGIGLLKSFCTQRGFRYQRELSSPLTAETSCSRLSPHLSFGTLSLREVVQAMRRRIAALDPEQAGSAIWRRSLQACISRLHWHCHFMQKLETEPDIEFQNMYRGCDGLREPFWDEARYRAWERGETGIPFVDACMRSLRTTGWLNFRMRAMLCSFASYQLWLHWREPSLHLARVFTDYEPGIHFSQMQMQSGTTAINTIRMYNPVKQGRDQDPDGAFIKTWCPELQAVPLLYIHEPWLADAGVLAKYGVALGSDYPHPIVNHVEAARQARDLMWSTRGDANHKTEAARIQAKHGSKTSGMPQIKRVKRTKARPSDPRLELPFDDRS